MASKSEKKSKSISKNDFFKFVLWLQRLLEASSAAPQAKRIWNDTDMLSVRNAFVEMYRGGVDIATGA